MPYIENNSSKIYYEVHGKGKPLLLLHGWNGTSLDFKQLVHPKTGLKRTIILMDLPGCGESGSMELSFDSLNTLILSLFDKLRIEKADIGGFCMGAIIALDFAIRNPLKVSKVFLIEIFIEYPAVILPLLIVGINRALMKFFLFTHAGNNLMAGYLLIKGRRYDDDFITKYRKADIKVSLEYMKLMWHYSFINHYERMGVLNDKLHVIRGKQAGQASLTTAKRILKNVKSAKLHIIDNAGHFPLVENFEGTADILKKCL